MGNSVVFPVYLPVEEHVFTGYLLMEMKDFPKEILLQLRGNLTYKENNQFVKSIYFLKILFYIFLRIYRH